MEFKFTEQKYQADAVKSITDVFNGNVILDSKYRVDKGIIKRVTTESFLMDDLGYKNSDITLMDNDLLKNINEVQKQNSLAVSSALSQKFGRCSLDITMETGTGKTYVYIKTIYELYKLYGWRKFIIVVPSIAIREGVYKSFQITEKHFQGVYSKDKQVVLKYFIYNSSNLYQLDEYSASDDINVMIINSQAFATSMKKDGIVKKQK